MALLTAALGISFTFVRRHDEETENKSKADFATKEGDRHVYEAWKKNLSEEEQKKVYEYEKTLINSGGGRLVVYYLTAGSLLIFPAGTYEHAVIVPANQARSVALFYNVATPDETFSKEHTGETLSNNLCQLKKP